MHKCVLNILLLLLFGLILGCRDLSESNTRSATYIHPLLEMPTGVLAEKPSGLINISAAVVMNQLYENLFYYDEFGNIKPLLIDNWSISDDYLNYRLLLKKGVRFHDGQALTSNDVIYSLITASGYRNEIKDISINGDVKKTFSKCGEHCVSVRLTRPYPMLLSVLTGFMFKIYPDGYVERGGIPSGSGPYKLTFRDGSSFNLVRFEGYHERTTNNIQNVRFVLMSNDLAIEAFKRKEVDDLFEYPLIEKDLQLLKGKTINYPTFIYNYIGINTKIKPFNDLAVRQAIQYGLNAESLFEKYFNQHIRTYGLIPKGIMGGGNNYRLFIPSHKKAKDLLGQTTIRLPIRTEFWIRNQDWNEQLVSDIVQQLASIDILATIKHVDDDAFYNSYFSRKQPLFFISLGASYPEPSLCLNTFRSDSVDNDVLLDNKQIDHMLDNLSSEIEPQKRMELILKTEEMILQEAAIIPIYQRRKISIYQEYLDKINLPNIWYGGFLLKNINKRGFK